MKISPLELSLSLIAFGLITDSQITYLGLSIYQSAYIEPIRLDRGEVYKYEYIDEGNLMK